MGFIAYSNSLFSQNVGINSTGVAPDASAGLDVSFTDKGVLIPRVDISDLSTAAPITSPATSLVVYNTNTTTGPGYFYWDGSKWVKLFDSNDGKPWLLTGNSGTTVGTNFLGTTDNVSLSFKTNNTERMRILNTGNVGIGTTSPGVRLEVNGGAHIGTGRNTNALSSSFSFHDPDGGLYTYTQLVEEGWAGGHAILWNAYKYNHGGTGGLATTGKIRYANNVGAYNGGAGMILFEGNNGILNFYISPSSTGQNTNVVWGTPKMTILRNGNVGISTISPRTKLDVVGTHPGAGSGTGTNSDAPSQAIIPAGSDGYTRYNDWPNGWAGGLSTWDIVGSSTYFSGYQTRSDKRFKKDIRPFHQQSIDKFMQLRPVSYFINPETLPVDDPDRLRFGFIANEVEDIFPNIVVNAGLPDDIARGLEYDAFIPLLVYVVQQQMKEIETLKAEIKNLQHELNNK